MGRSSSQKAGEGEPSRQRVMPSGSEVKRASDIQGTTNRPAGSVCE